MRIIADVRAVAFGSLALLACGCGTDAPATLRTLGSWAATGAMLGHAWSDGATPPAYTERTLERAQRELAEQARELGTLPASERTAAWPVTERVARSLRELAVAVRTDRRADARTLAERLADDARRLQELAARVAS